MKIYKILIALLLIILAIGAVSASENITNDATPSEDNSSEPISNDEDISEEYNHISIEVEENIEILPTPNQTINIYGMEYTSGNFSISIDGEMKDIQVKTKYLPPRYWVGQIYLEFDATNLTYGEHRYDVHFTGDEYYKPTTISGTFSVSPIVLKVPSAYYLQSTYDNNRENLEDRVYVEIQYLKNITGIAYLYMNGVEKKINLSDFKAKGDMGSYEDYTCYIYSYYKYDLIDFDEYRDCYVYGELIFFDKPTNFTLKYENITKSAFMNLTYDVKFYKEIKKGSNLEIFLPKGISKNVKVEIDGKTYKLYKKTIDADYNRLEFYVKTNTLNYGRHTIKITTPLYTISRTFGVVGNTVSPNTVYMYHGDSKTVTLTVYGEGKKVISKGEEVYITIDQDNEYDYNYYYYYKYVKANGKVSLKIPAKLKPGTHKIVVESYENDLWDIPGKVKLVVKHVVNLKTVKVKKSAKKLTLQVTLKNKKPIKGKTVTFKFNGKTYKAKTNSKGIAKVTIKKAVLKKLKVGKKVTYQATYLKDTVKKTAKVQK